MPGKGFNLDEYVDVAERISLFREKHPEGSLQSEIILPDATAFVTVKAYAYRTPDDPRPGIGHAWEPYPGKTPYTKDSELQNAETSAWGRAIVAALAADTKKIASKQEVRNRQDWPEAVDSAAPAVAAATVESTSTSEGGPGGVSTPESRSYGEGEQPDSPPDDLDAVIRAYGSSAKAMLVARGLWPGATSLAGLNAEDRRALIELKQKMEAP